MSILSLKMNLSLTKTLLKDQVKLLAGILNLFQLNRY